jgi:predicted DNA-binding protein
MNKTKPMLVYLTDTQFEQLRKLSFYQRRPKSVILREAIADYIKNLKLK